MISSKEEKDRLSLGWFVFLVIGSFFVILGLSLIFGEADAWATVNGSAIAETQTDLAGFTEPIPAFHVGWLILLLIVLASFMVTTFKMREDRETVYFALGALIVSIILTLLFTSPLPFDIQENISTTEITANQTQVTGATVTTQLKQTIIIPNDSEFRSMFSLLFTGNTLFLGLYSIYILTNFHNKGKLH